MRPLLGLHTYLELTHVLSYLRISIPLWSGDILMLRVNWTSSFYILGNGANYQDGLCSHQ